MSNSKFTPDENSDLSRAYMQEELGRFPNNIADVPDSNKLSIVYNEPLARPANVKDVYNRNYSQETGTPLSHPLELMTLIVQENNWADLAVKTIASACAGTDPLFQIYSKANGRNKSVAANRKMELLIDKLMYPNLQQTGYELFLSTYENITVYGNGFWQIIRNKKGDIHSIYNLPPETIRIIPYTDKHGILHTAYYQMDLISTGKTGNKGNVYLEHEIIHFKETNEKSFLYGKPRLYSLLAHITANSQALTGINNWFQEGFAGGAIFQVDGESDSIARNREFLRDNYSGAQNYGKMLLLEGSVKLVDKGEKFIGNIKFEEMAAIGRDTILTCMGVPVSMAGVRSDAGMGNAEIVASEEKAFKRSTVDRLHALVFGKIQQKLVREFLDDKDLQIQAGVLNKFSLKDEAEAVRVLSTIGISIGEAREILGMRSLELDSLNNQMVVMTNNGSARFEDVIGINPVDGSKCETIFEKQFELSKMQAEAAVDSANAKIDAGTGNGKTTTSTHGLGGKLKDASEGK